MASTISVVIAPRARSIGPVTVGRVLPVRQRRSVGPFVFLDHIGPLDLAPGDGIDVLPHPHIGLATVTYLFDGAFVHRDSLGVVQEIQPEEVNWMTAGRGIVHSERTPPHLRAAGHRVHGLQSWVGLPAAVEDCEPSFQHHGRNDLPVSQRDGVTTRAVLGAGSPVRVASPTTYTEARFAAGGILEIPPSDDELAFYLISGAVTIDDQRLDSAALVVFHRGAAGRVVAEVPAHGVLLGGAPLDGKREIFWNFVSSSRDKIEHAKAAWREDRFPPIPGETGRVPLPELFS